jgi:uncharacterized membrane protein (DUF4010 family)
MSPNGVVALRLGIALGIGLLIGAERERRKGEGPIRGAAGIRTFAIASLLGAVSLQLGGLVLLAVMVAAVAGFATISYLRTQQADPGLTTESALLLTTVIGGMAMREPALASAVAVVIAILLAARTRLHGFVCSVLTEQELHDALIFAAAVVVVLPLMPNRYLGPFAAINPRTIWKIVVLMMSVSALGYIAVRAMGPKIGLPLAGLASGFASSVATIASMGARTHEQTELARPATAGAVLSSVATIIELAILLTATSRAVLWQIKFPLIAAGAAILIYGAVFTLKTLKQHAPEKAPAGSAFNLRVTLILAATVTGVLLASAAVNAKLGRAGVVVAAAIAGFGDTHSAAVSVASLVANGKMSAHDAVIPVFAALTTNSITKAVFAYTSGGWGFAARVLPGLVVMLAALWIALAI